MAFVKLGDSFAEVYAARARWARIDFEFTASNLMQAGYAPYGEEWTTLLDFHDIFTGMNVAHLGDDQIFVLSEMGIDYENMTHMVRL